jgi:hypothetical protein
MAVRHGPWIDDCRPEDRELLIPTLLYAVAVQRALVAAGADD